MDKSQGSKNVEYIAQGNEKKKIQEAKELEIRSKKKEKVVNIIALGWGGNDAPFNDGDRWGINCSYVYGKMDRVLWMHRPEMLGASLRLGKDTESISGVLKRYPDMEIVALNNMNIEEDPDDPKKLIFNLDMSKQQGKLIKRTKAYPIAEYLKMMGTVYAVSSLMYAVGLAIIEGYDRIRLYGVECFSRIDNWEYSFESTSLSHMIFLAIGKGIKVEVPFQTLITASNGVNNYYGYHSFKSNYT